MQSLYAFKNLKALAHDLIHASLCEGSFFYFYVESVFLFFVFHKQTLVSILCNMGYMQRIGLVILLCVDDIHEINMLKVEAIAET